MADVVLRWLRATVQFRVLRWEDLRPGDLVWAFSTHRDTVAYGPFRVIDPPRRRVRTTAGDEWELPPGHLPAVPHLAGGVSGEDRNLDPRPGAG